MSPAGVSAGSGYVRAQTSAAPPVPARPTGLTATSVGHDSVTLGWDDPADSSVTGYQVLRRVGSSGPFTAIEDNTGSAAAGYTDSTVQADTDYEYRVIAVNGDGASPESDSLSARTLPGLTFAAVTPVPAPEPSEEDLIALYGSIASTEEIFSTETEMPSHRVGSITTYLGYLTGSPITQGSMDDTTVSTTEWWDPCPNGDSCSATITEMYFVHDRFRWSLVVRMGKKMNDAWTLTIGDRSYSVEDSSYFNTSAEFHEVAVSAGSHIWRGITPPTQDANDEYAVSIDRPVPQPLTFDVLNDVDWSGTMKPGTRREKPGAHPGFDVVILGYERSTRKGSFVFGNDTIPANSKQYRILDFNIAHTKSGSVLAFRVEGGRLGDDATLHISGRSYPVTDARWDPVTGTHLWYGLPYRLGGNRELPPGQRQVSITSD